MQTKDYLVTCYGVADNCLIIGLHVKLCMISKKNVKLCTLCDIYLFIIFFQVVSNRTIFRLGFCNIQNNKGFCMCYQILLTIVIVTIGCKVIRSSHVW